MRPKKEKLGIGYEILIQSPKSGAVKHNQCDGVWHHTQWPLQWGGMGSGISNLRPNGKT